MSQVPSGVNRPAGAFTTLITPAQLMDLQKAGGRVMVFDCSFDLANPAAGEEQYRASHIAGAVYANLDHELSDAGTVGADGAAGSVRPAQPGGARPRRHQHHPRLTRVGIL